MILEQLTSLSHGKVAHGVWGCKVLSHLWEMVKGWIFINFLSSGSCYYKTCGNLLFLERLLLSA